jgi:hypothetical protein
MKQFLRGVWFVAVLMAFSACGVVDDPIVPSSETQAVLWSDNEIEDFALHAQALLGGYDVEALTAVTRLTHYEAKEDFGASRPSADGEGIAIYAYQPTLKEQGSEYDYVWYKFKSPQAIDEVLSIPTVGERASAERILEFAFEEARELVPEVAARVDARGFTFVFGSHKKIIGPQWKSAKLVIELREDKVVYVSTPTLVSSTLFSAFSEVGGMSYLKAITPSMAARILIDLAQGNHDRLPFANPGSANLELAAGPFHSAAHVRWYGAIGNLLAQKALLFVDQDYQTSGEYLGTVIISAGGYIPALSMRGLAKEIASQGYVVFVVKYSGNLAFLESIDFRKPSYLNLANLIKKNNVGQIQGLLPSVESFYSDQDAPVVVFGHSLGGAALGPVLFGDENPFDTIILSGVTSFMKSPFHDAVQADDVHLFFGANESKTEEDYQKALDQLSIGHEPGEDGIYRADGSNRTMELIDDLNHFCIISDMNVGSQSKRDGDGDGARPSDAVRIFAAHLMNRGLL